MARQSPLLNDEVWLEEGSPSGLYVRNIPPYVPLTDVAALTTAVMLSVALPLQAGDLVTNLSFVSGNTAADTPTHSWFALYSSATTPALLGQSADKTTTAWAADTVKTLPLATAVLISKPGLYYASICVVATGVPSLACSVVARAKWNGAIASSKVLAQTSGSALTDTAPGTIDTPTTVANCPLVVAT